MEKDVKGKGGKNTEKKGNKHKNKKLNIDLDLSPENLELFRERYKKEVTKGFHNRIKKILMKPREQWTAEEIAFLNKKFIPILEGTVKDDNPEEKED